MPQSSKRKYRSIMVAATLSSMSQLTRMARMTRLTTHAASRTNGTPSRWSRTLFVSAASSRAPAFSTLLGAPSCSPHSSPKSLRSSPLAFSSCKRPPVRTKSLPFHSALPSKTTVRYLSSNNNDGSKSTESDLLPNKTGDRNGLIRHQIIAEDGHPLRLYSREPRSNNSSQQSLLNASNGGENGPSQRSILLLHGRTWSSQPVFDLRTSPDDEKRQSTLQSLADLGFHAYALDLRGFGETPRDGFVNDSTNENGGGYTTPRRCVEDVKCAIEWVTRRHCNPPSHDSENSQSPFTPDVQDPTKINTKPALLGWSQGALIAQMYAQKYGPSTLSDLILFGSIFDPKVIYPRTPLYDPAGNLASVINATKPPAPHIPNTDIASLEDFTLPGTICDEAALAFSTLALTTDPHKAPWDNLHEFNVCNPALVHIPTMVVVGDQDPYVSWEAQKELFERLGTEDRVWCVLPGCDHAAHILKARRMFVRSVVGFLLRKDGF